MANPYWSEDDECIELFCPFCEDNDVGQMLNICKTTSRVDWGLDENDDEGMPYSDGHDDSDESDEIDLGYYCNGCGKVFDKPLPPNATNEQQQLYRKKAERANRTYQAWVRAKDRATRLVATLRALVIGLDCAGVPPMLESAHESAVGLLQEIDPAP